MLRSLQVLLLPLRIPICSKLEPKVYTRQPQLTGIEVQCEQRGQIFVACLDMYRV
jgi:hypothetical protein